MFSNFGWQCRRLHRGNLLENIRVSKIHLKCLTYSLLLLLILVSFYCNVRHYFKNQTIESILKKLKRSNKFKGFVSDIENHDEITRSDESLVINDDTKLILLWTNYFHSPNWFTELAFNLNLKDTNCPLTNCVFSTDRTKVSNATAVLFHASDFNIHDVPLQRTSNQVYIWYNLEAPGVYNLKSRPCIKPLTTESGAGSNGFFNWTFTYNSASEVTLGYGYVYPKEKGQNSIGVSDHKKKVGAWVVSNCKTDSGRERYIEDLTKHHLPIDVFGYCTDRECPEDCFGYLALRYHFYFSFENNRCIDYITEKVWVPLKAGLIPVVYGGGRYSDYLPKNSYVDAGDYEPGELALFLTNLTNHPAELRKYHTWRSTYGVEIKPSWCELCLKLQDFNPSEPVVQKELLPWWVSVNKCFTNYSRVETKLKINLNSIINLFGFF